MDTVSETRLALVHPTLAGLVRQMSDLLIAQGVNVRVTQGLRTWDQQQALYDQGRTVPGKIVTNAKPGYSWHNFGLAVDLVPMLDTGPDWNDQHPTWKQMLAAGQQVGLAEGALWHTFRDEPHFQWTGVLPVSPDNETRALYQASGLDAVWAKAAS